MLIAVLFLAACAASSPMQNNQVEISHGSFESWIAPTIPSEARPNPGVAERRDVLSKWSPFISTDQSAELLSEYPLNVLWTEFTDMLENSDKMCRYYVEREISPTAEHALAAGLDIVPLLFNRYRSVAVKASDNCGLDDYLMPDCRISRKIHFYELTNGAMIRGDTMHPFPERYLKYVKHFKTMKEVLHDAAAQANEEYY